MKSGHARNRKGIEGEEEGREESEERRRERK
jgi:hypothetical protein